VTSGPASTVSCLREMARCTGAVVSRNRTEDMLDASGARLKPRARARQKSLKTSCQDLTTFANPRVLILRCHATLVVFKPPGRTSTDAVLVSTRRPPRAQALPCMAAALLEVAPSQERTSCVGRVQPVYTVV